MAKTDEHNRDEVCDVLLARRIQYIDAYAYAYFNLHCRICISLYWNLTIWVPNKLY